MIGFVDKPPTIEPQGDGFLLTFQSGAEPVKLWLTRHAFAPIGWKAERAIAEAKVADADHRKVVAFPKPKKWRPAK